MKYDVVTSKDVFIDVRYRLFLHPPTPQRSWGAGVKLESACLFVYSFVGPFVVVIVVVIAVVVVVVISITPTVVGGFFHIWYIYSLKYTDVSCTKTFDFNLNSPGHLSIILTYK